MATEAMPILSKTWTQTALPYSERGNPYSPGQVFWNAERSKAYRCVIAKDLALVAGWLVTFTSDDDLKSVTGDRAGGTADTRPAGLALNAIPLGDVGFIQIAGVSDVDALTDGGIAAGDSIIQHATTDGAAETATTSTLPDESFGVALDADTATTLPAGELVLRCTTLAQPAPVA